MYTKFYDNTIITKFVQYLLAKSNIPLISYFKPGTPVRQDQLYIYKNNIYKVEASWDTITDSGEYILPDESSNFVLEGGKKPLFKFIQPYVFGEKYQNITTNFVGDMTEYGPQEHIYLGEYLRAIRGFYGINLMPFYNCFNNVYLNNVDLVVNGTDIRCVEQDVEDGYKILSVPIKFNEKYSIYIDSETGFDYCPVIYGKNTLVKNGELTNNLLTAIGYSGKNSNYLRCRVSRFTDPFIVNEITIPKLLENGMDTNLQQYEPFLRLLIKIPDSNRSSVVVLEGDYTEVPKTLVKSNREYNKPNYVVGPQTQGELSYTSNGDGTCKVSGIGSFPGETLKIPATSPHGERVTGISARAFYNNTDIKSVIIPNFVEEVGLGAFEGCASLQSITIPFVGDRSENPGHRIFGWLFGATSYSNQRNYVPVSLKTVIITGGDTIYVSAFRNCNSLTSITIPDSVESIGNYAFSYCASLTSVTIPDSVTSIGAMAFAGCQNLTSVTIPVSVLSIGNSAFSRCTSLTNVYITNIEAWCGISFGNNTANPLYYAEKLYLNETLVTDLIIPNSVTSIGNSAFLNCTSLTSVTIPDSVLSIGRDAFNTCTSLTSITIPSSVTSIGDRVFYNCNGLTSVTIGNSVTGIGSYAFAGCSSLSSITVNNTMPPSLGNVNAFDNTNDCPIFVPVGSLSAYQTATNWGDLYNAGRIQEIPSI